MISNDTYCPCTWCKHRKPDGACGDEDREPCWMCDDANG